jgi:predicted RNase H-like HicB family nuclease
MYLLTPKEAMMNYNTKTVCKIIGLSRRQVDYWDRSHFIKPTVNEASGYGSVRLYSFTDLIQLKVAKTLKDAGISLQKIRKSLNYLKKHIPEIKKPLLNMRFLTDGSSIFVLTSNRNTILDTLKGGQLVFSIALGEIVQELNGKGASFSKEKRYTVIVKGNKYEVILHPDSEDGGFWVECPALAGCASQGDTIEEALEMIKDAIDGHLEVLKEDKSLDVKKAKAS